VVTAAVVVAGGLALGWLLLREHDARIRESATAAQSRDSLVNVVASTLLSAQVKKTSDSLAFAALIRQRDAALAGQRRRADSLAANGQALLDSLIAVTADTGTLAPVLGRLRASLASEQEARQRERADADSTISARDVRLRQIESAYDHDMAMVRSQLATAIVQLDAANRRASPGVWSRALRTLPWVAGAAIVGRLTR